MNKTLHKKHSLPVEIPNQDFYAGYITAHGSFFWTTINKEKIPVFQLKTRYSDKKILELFKKRVNLTQKIYTIKQGGSKYCLLLVRNRTILTKKIIPFFDCRLFGEKERTFSSWKNNVIKYELIKDYGDIPTR